MIHVKTKKILDTLQNKTEDELAIVDETQKVYVYKDGAWEEFNQKEGLTISLMELNSLAVSQLAPLTEEELEEGKQLIREFVDEDRYYYMLLSNELHYYTVFIVIDDEGSTPLIEDEVIACLQDMGDIKSIEKTDDGAMEMWVTIEDKSYPFYFFNYKKGIIICK